MSILLSSWGKSNQNGINYIYMTDKNKLLLKGAEISLVAPNMD